MVDETLNPDTGMAKAPEPTITLVSDVAPPVNSFTTEALPVLVDDKPPEEPAMIVLPPMEVPQTTSAPEPVEPVTLAEVAAEQQVVIDAKAKLLREQPMSAKTKAEIEAGRAKVMEHQGRLALSAAKRAPQAVSEGERVQNAKTQNQDL